MANKLILNLARTALIATCALMLVLALHPDVRSEVRDSLIKDYRTVVSTVQADLTGQGMTFTVAKIKTRDALFLEIYEKLGDGTSRLVEKIEMPDKKDGFFSFNGQATNLAAEDIDGDGRPEILAPSFDHNLVGHINVYSYNKDVGSFERALR